jgi:hypothetical protein
MGEPGDLAPGRMLTVLCRFVQNEEAYRLDKKFRYLLPTLCSEGGEPLKNQPIVENS